MSVSTNYDSTADTLKHIRRVNALLICFATKLLERAARHDESKLHPPEKECFDLTTPKLAGLTYGSDEYRAALKEIKPALDHHYAVNSHHPEHWGAGISDMNLLDLVEMFFDWKAATERHADGDLVKSCLHNQKRFEYPDMLKQIFVNMANDCYDW